MGNPAMARAQLGWEPKVKFDELARIMVFMFMGEVVEHGPAEELFNAPKDERIRVYLSGEVS
jgi:ABC-type phosphate transport system ATPase subunit